ncbi:hypothetical protein BDI4_570022 [Burkholderia diffusa]|nr:hypothetical protein BDI4_570022 [Burkholderia diffusa]
MPRYATLLIATRRRSYIRLLWCFSGRLAARAPLLCLQILQLARTHPCLAILSECHRGRHHQQTSDYYVAHQRNPYLKEGRRLDNYRVPST